ncbi:DUF3016 domain-containing protein [Pseudochelatococcus sp. B33]
MFRRFATGLAMATMLMPSLVQAGVDVRFVAPERFADRDFQRAATRAEAMKVFETFLVDLGERHLGKGRPLTIEVLDVRLAGDYGSSWSMMHDVRVLTGTTPPRFDLRYTLKEGGRVVAQGRESITDVNYQSNPAARTSADRFVYEKALLESWFRKRFVGRKPAGS